MLLWEAECQGVIRKRKNDSEWLLSADSVKCVFYSLLCGGSDLCGEKSGRRQPGKSLPASIVPHTVIRTASIHIFTAVVPQFWDGLLKREAVMLIRHTDWMRSLKFPVTKTGSVRELQCRWPVWMNHFLCKVSHIHTYPILNWWFRILSLLVCVHMNMLMDIHVWVHMCRCVQSLKLVIIVHFTYTTYRISSTEITTSGSSRGVPTLACQVLALQIDSTPFPHLHSFRAPELQSWQLTASTLFIEPYPWPIISILIRIKCFPN